MIFLVLSVFVVLLIAGVSLQELTWRHVGWVSLVEVGFLFVVGIFHLQPYFFTVATALLDFILVLVIFKGDVRI
jgi:hypothetical protein